MTAGRGHAVSADGLATEYSPKHTRPPRLARPWRASVLSWDDKAKGKARTEPPSHVPRRIVREMVREERCVEKGRGPQQDQRHGIRSDSREKDTAREWRQKVGTPSREQAPWRRDGVVSSTWMHVLYILRNHFAAAVGCSMQSVPSSAEPICDPP